MSVALATILIAAFLLPGVVFIGGISARERLSRDIVRAGALGEIAIALAVALIAHLGGWFLLAALKVDVAQWATNLFHLSDALPANVNEIPLAKLVVGSSVYALAASAVALIAGWLVGLAMMKGWFRFLVTHKWTLDLVNDSVGTVTANVMTKIVVNNRAIMYQGTLHEFYLNKDGQFSYLTLRNCTRSFMRLDTDQLVASDQMELFKIPDGRRWHYLVIDGPDINNVLFEKTKPIIVKGEEDTKAQATLSAEVERATKAEAS